MSGMISKIFEGLFFALYTVAWRVARPFLRRHKRLSHGFAMRLVPHDWSRQADIWVQAASGGEAYLAWELLKALPCFSELKSPLGAPQSRPCHILLTSCTSQGLDILEQATAWAQEQCILRGIEHLTVSVQVFPLDEPSIMRRAVKLASPRLVVLLETELWPSLIRACSHANVPLMVLNGRMSVKSFGAYFIMRGFWRNLGQNLGQGMRKNTALSSIAAISHDDAMRFSMLFGIPTKVVQNIKFDRVAIENIGMKQAHVPSLLPDGSKVVLLASVREEEEPMLVAALCQLTQKLERYGTSGTSYTFIIAPRHMHRVTAWQDRLHRVGISTILRSSLAHAPDVQEMRQNVEQKARTTKPVMIWDTFGELGVLYGLSHAVFVGGSLVPLGGQNFLEPLAQGLVPCVGPYLNNFAWVDIDSLVAADLLHIVRTDVELADILYAQLTCTEQDIQRHEAVRACFENWLAPRRGGTKASVHMLMDVLQEED